MTAAMLLNLLVAAIVSYLIPVTMQKLCREPAFGSDCTHQSLCCYTTALIILKNSWPFAAHKGLGESRISKKLARGVIQISVASVR